MATGVARREDETMRGKMKTRSCTITITTELTGGVIWIVWFIHFRTQSKHGGALPGYRLPIEAVAVAIVMVTGHLGGFLSGVNGPG
jgi:hypothetical protein